LATAAPVVAAPATASRPTHVVTRFDFASAAFAANSQFTGMPAECAKTFEVAASAAASSAGLRARAAAAALFFVATSGFARVASAVAG
jgi:hypothetical protein